MRAPPSPLRLTTAPARADGPPSRCFVPPARARRSGLVRLLRTDARARTSCVALELWEELQSSGLTLDAAAYSAAASAYAAHGTAAQARGLVDDMLGRGLSPGVRMCVALPGGACACGRPAAL